VIALAVLAGVACAAIAGGVAYKLADRHPAKPSGPAAVSPGTGLTPQGTVLAYFAAINHHRFMKAWELGGEKGSLPAFEKGYVGTAHDAVRITNVQGNVVTVTLRALQSDGSVKLYSGTYTVENGVIVGSDIQLQSDN
jgi:eukaryotic-like serine/threonine-protein kinase